MMMMKSFVLLLCALLAVVVVGIQTDETDHQKEIRKIETGIDQLLHRITKLENGIDARRAPDKVQGYKNLSYRVSKVEGGMCRKDFFQCSGNDPQCVSDLLICDGQPDCRNGADERDCGLPFQTGEKLNVTFMYHDCSFRGLPSHPYFQIDFIELSENFKASAKVRITVDFDYKDGVYHFIDRAVGNYKFASRVLEVLWLLNEKFAWIIDFNDHTISVLYGESDFICGKGTFKENRFAWIIDFNDHTISVLYGESDFVCGKGTFKEN